MKVFRVQLGSKRRDLLVEVSLEFRTRIEQVAVLKAEYDRRCGVQFSQMKLFKAVDGGGIRGPDLDAAVEICISRAEEVSAD